MNSFMWFIIIATSIWVYFDAVKIGARRGLIQGFFNLGPLSWALACILLWIVSFPAYIVQRPKIIEAARQQESSCRTISHQVRQSGLNTTSKVIAIGWTMICGIGIFFGMINLGESAPVGGTDFENAGFAIGTALGLGMWLVIWAAIAVPATFTFLLTRKSGMVIVEQPAAAEPQGRTRHCPYCAELIKEDAIFCRHCRKDLLRHVSEPDPQPAIVPPPPPSADWLARGREYLKAGEFKEAIAALTKIIDRQPDGDSYYLRAVAYSKMKEQERMIADLKEATRYGHEKATATLAKIS